MRRSLLSLSFCVLILSACGPEEVVLEQSAVDAKVDSLIGLRMEDVARRAAEDLEKRQAIEVKVKADSIISARGAGPTAPAATP